MSKNKSSYEGFRRKNSLNSHQANKRNTSMESLQSKIKREDLKLVESLSLQLESFSKRPLTSRNFGQNGLKHVKSCHSIKFYHDQAFQPKLFSIQRPEPNSLKKISYELQDQPIELAEIKRQKFGNLLGFNQFDTIEETRSFCQQEMIEDISPVTLKHSLHQPLDKQNKLLNKRNIRVAATPRPVYKKQSAAIKNDHLNPKKEKMKHDLTELDKMQKQLQNKKANRDNFTAKLISHKTAVQRQKQAVNVQGLFKDSSKLKLLPNKDIKNQAVKTNSFKHSKSTLPLAKASLPNPLKKLQKTEENIEQQQMVATRMLSDKQKSNLINSLSHLRQIIEKNEICSDSNDQILFHMNSIQKLLTR